MNTQHCPHCKQIIMVRRRLIRRGMINGLVRLVDEGESKTADLGMDFSSICDFTKLKYWGLIEDGMAESTYRVTGLGLRFIRGEVSIPKYRWIFNDLVQKDPYGKPNPEIFIWDIDPMMINLKDIRKNSITGREYNDQKSGDLFL